MAQMKVFVSHSHDDDAFCRALVDGLRRAGADVRYDEHNLGSGLLLDKVEAQLHDRPVFVLVLSPSALKSQWVSNETKWAFQRLQRDPSRIILPVLAKALPDEDAVWLFLQGFRRVEAPGGQPYAREEAVRRTLHALQLAPPSGATLPVAPPPARSATDLVARGEALVEQNKYDEALPLFLRATQLDPNSFHAWFYLGLARNETGQHGPDVEAYDCALALLSSDVWAWNNKGKALSDLKRYDEALAACDRALALDPNNVTAWFNKVDTLDELGRHEEALAAFDRALTLDPTRASVWHNKATCLRALGRIYDAAEAEQRAQVWENDAINDG